MIGLRLVGDLRGHLVLRTSRPSESDHTEYNDCDDAISRTPIISI